MATTRTPKDFWADLDREDDQFQDIIIETILHNYTTEHYGKTPCQICFVSLKAECNPELHLGTSPKILACCQQLRYCS